MNQHKNTPQGLPEGNGIPDNLRLVPTEEEVKREKIKRETVQRLQGIFGGEFYADALAEQAKEKNIPKEELNQAVLKGLTPAKSQPEAQPATKATPESTKETPELPAAENLIRKLDTLEEKDRKNLIRKLEESSLVYQFTKEGKRVYVNLKIAGSKGNWTIQKITHDGGDKPKVDNVSSPEKVALREWKKVPTDKLPQAGQKVPFRTHNGKMVMATVGVDAETGWQLVYKIDNDKFYVSGDDLRRYENGGKEAFSSCAPARLKAAAAPGEKPATPDGTKEKVGPLSAPKSDPETLEEAKKLIKELKEKVEQLEQKVETAPIAPVSLETPKGKVGKFFSWLRKEALPTIGKFFKKNPVALMGGATVAGAFLIGGMLISLPALAGIGIGGAIGYGADRLIKKYANGGEERGEDGGSAQPDAGTETAPAAGKKPGTPSQTLSNNPMISVRVQGTRGSAPAGLKPAGAKSAPIETATKAPLPVPESNKIKNLSQVENAFKSKDLKELEQIEQNLTTHIDRKVGQSYIEGLFPRDSANLKGIQEAFDNRRVPEMLTMVKKMLVQKTFPNTLDALALKKNTNPASIATVLETYFREGAIFPVALRQAGIDIDSKAGMEIKDAKRDPVRQKRLLAFLRSGTSA